ncbi:MAG: hypothetical protein ACU83N_13050 [Gammaproteobacteria bacterium]
MRKGQSMGFGKLLILQFALLCGIGLLGCTSSRQIVVDYPATQPIPLEPLGGGSTVDGDDFYIQLVSEFDFKGDNILKSGCGDLGAGYETADLSAAVVFKVKNEPLKYQQDVTGFVYKATSGKCNFKLETKKASLTPWLRLDVGKDTVVDYHFFTSNKSDTNISKLIGDVNATTNLLALTGVGAGVALMGKLATEWAQASPTLNQAATLPADAKYSSEIHTLPTPVQLSGQGALVQPSRLGVYEIVEGGMSFSSSEPKLLGELKVYPEIIPSLLLRLSPGGIPKAQDLSLAELLDTPIRTAEGNVELKALIGATEHADKPNLEPDWSQYDEVEGNCRKLKRVIKELGFNKYDRNAVLYYFLERSPDWKNYNISAVRAMADEIRPAKLEQYRSRNFSGCLVQEDYSTMALMGLAVNNPQDWQNILASRQKQESLFSPVQSAGRQLVAVMKNPNPTEMARQIYPLISTGAQGNGTVLLQNHLGDFGLETVLGVETVPGEGLVITAEQFEKVFSWLYLDQLSCTRPLLSQRKAIGKIGILLFTTQDGAPWPKGGALEFEMEGDKIVRLTFQHPSYRDFERNLKEIPVIGSCRIKQSFVDQLH